MGHFRIPQKQHNHKAVKRMELAHDTTPYLYISLCNWTQAVRRTEWKYLVQRTFRFERDLMASEAITSFKICGTLNVESGQPEGLSSSYSWAMLGSLDRHLPDLDLGRASPCCHLPVGEAES